MRNERCFDVHLPRPTPLMPRSAFALPSLEPWARHTILLTLAGGALLYLLPEGGGPFWDLIQIDEKTVLPFFLGGTLLLLLPTGSAIRTPQIVIWLGEHPIAVSLATIAILCVLSLSVYHGQPLTQDEFAPWFQAHVFADRKVFATYPIEWLKRLFDPGYHGTFFILDWRTGEVASAYWPGQALLMAPFAWLGIPWAFNPAITGATTYVLWRIAKEQSLTPTACGWVILFAIASPAFVINGISFYSMPAHLLLSLLYAWLLLGHSPLRMVAAGVVGSLALVLHNPVPHILFSLPWIVWVALRDRNGLRNLALLGIGYAPLAILLGFGWASMRSLYSCSPQCAAGAVNAAEAIQAQGSSLLGSLAGGAFVLPNARIFELRAGAAIKVWMSAVPGLVLLAWIGFRSTGSVALRLLGASAALTFVGYFFIPFSQGHGWGYRYFHAAWGALPLLAAAGLQNSADTERRARVLRVAIFSLIVLVGAKLFVVYRFTADHWRQMPPHRGSPSEIVFKNGLGYWGLDLIQNRPDLTNRPLFLISQGHRADRRFIEAHVPDARQTAMSWLGNTYAASKNEKLPASE